MKIGLLLVILLVAVVGVYIFFYQEKHVASPLAETDSAPSFHEAKKVELKNNLSPEAYDIIVNKGTERPFTSLLNNEYRKGTYVAVDTGKPVFRSEDKFDSGTGWPSFTKPISPDAVITADDYGFLGRRTEVLSTDGGHLGHVFNDGPLPTGLRYCMNGAALRFVPDEE